MNNLHFNFLIIPYRDSYFQIEFGDIVRDLQIIRAIRENENVNRVAILNRPVSIYERFYGKRKSKLNIEGCEIVDYTSFDILGPLKKRVWTEGAYSPYLSKVAKILNFDQGMINVLLDFTPIAKIDYKIFDKFYYWYDLIDNFAKHNRYSLVEREKVTEKYKCLSAEVDLITGVSKAALKHFPKDKTIVVPNGLIEDFPDFVIPKTIAPFTFGFMGFITDKFDIAMVSTLLEGNDHTLAVFGEAYDRNVYKDLCGINRVKTFGKFKREDLPQIMSMFNIGLIPYLRTKSHDESPLKLYEYLRFGKPVVSSQYYDIDNCYINVYNLHDSTMSFVEKNILDMSMNPGGMYNDIVDSISDECFWRNKIKNILNRIICERR